MSMDNDRYEGHVGTTGTRSIPTPTLSDGMRCRILLADDETNVRSLLKRLLALQGWDVVEAANGREAVDAWPEDGAPFDLVILDMNMPILGGLAAYEELKRLHPQMVVLFISGYVEESSWRDVILKGKVPFLAKPFTPQQLVATATALVAHGRVQAAARSVLPMPSVSRPTCVGGAF